MRSLKSYYNGKEGRVTDKWSLYIDEYEKLFSYYRDAKIRMLEIGIQNGGSLDIWGEYFHNAEIIIGCDINLDCLKLDYNNSKISVIFGDVNSLQSINNILKKSEEFDIIIDDGSHKSSDIIKTFAHYFSLLSNDGIYVVEDLHCSYWKDFEGGLYDPYSTISFFKQLTDIIGFEHWGIKKSRTEFLSRFTSRFDISFEEQLLKHIHSIEFINSICIIRKASPENNILGERVITGNIAQVNTELLDTQQNNTSQTPSQEDNIWSNIPKAPEEEYLQHKSKIKENEDIIRILKDELDGKNKLLSSILRSKSWRMTSFLRIIHKKLKPLF